MKSRLIYLLCQLFILSTALTSCCWPFYARVKCPPGCIDARRPQVMVEKDYYALDFDWRCPTPEEYREQNTERPCSEETNSKLNTCCRDEDFDGTSCILEVLDGPLNDANCLDIRRPIYRQFKSYERNSNCSNPCNPCNPCCKPCCPQVCCKCGMCECDCCCGDAIAPYYFAVGDKMTIAVEGEDETLAEEVTVAADGNIYYLFLNGIPAVGKSVDEVSEEIRSHLSALFKDPIVTISPLTSLNSTFTILGRVFNPGIYPVPGRIKLREAIAVAGGIIQRQFDEESPYNSYDPLPLANLQCSLLVRNGEKIPVDFYSLIFSADQTNNVDVLPGDYIYIAPAYNEQVFVVGNVSRPLRIPFQRGMTLMEALTIAGGWPEGYPQAADINNVLVLRGPLQCPCVVCVNINHIINGIGNNVILMPGDIIFVPNKTLRFGRELVLMAINTFVQSFATSAGSYYAQTYWFNPSFNSGDSDSDN